MEDIYLKLWELAKPYYLKGRPMDIAHIEWMMMDAQKVCDIEKLDASLLLPTCILHDVGYSAVEDIKQQGKDYYDLDVRRFHMDEGAIIAQDLLEQVAYPKDKLEKIVYYISVHDNWAYGEIDLYLNDPVLGTFKDLDYLWLFTKQGFESMSSHLGKNPSDYLKELEDEPLPAKGKKPWSNQTTQKLHDDYLLARQEDVNKI